MTQSPPSHAIPTMFNGVSHKSRLEANVAQMLVHLDIPYEYEPTSFLLDDGTHYMPDFWCPTIRLWIESRGYSNQKGDRQIRVFGDAVMAGRLTADRKLLPDPARSPVRSCGHPKAEGCPDDCGYPGWDGWRSHGNVDYMVLMPGGSSRFFEMPSEHTDQGRDLEVIVCLCKCGKFYFASHHNDWRCRVCGTSDKRYHLREWDRVYLDEFGRPTILCEWYDEGRKKIFRQEMTVPSWLDRIRMSP